MLLRPDRRWRLALACACALAFGQAGACGYDTVLGNSFGQAHVGSLDVAFAIRDGLESRQLASLDPLPADLSLMRIGGWLVRLQSRLKVPAGSPGPDFALLLVERGHWSRFDSMGASYLLGNAHLSDAPQGAVTVVSGEAVVAELLAGKLGAASALSAGLIRVYGNASDIAGLRAALLNSFPESPRS